MAAPFRSSLPATKSLAAFATCPVHTFARRAVLAFARRSVATFAVARRSGFSSAKQLCTIFHQLTGVTPTIYRRQAEAATR